MKLENTYKLAVTPFGACVNSIATTEGLHRRLRAVTTIVAEKSNANTIGKPAHALRVALPLLQTVNSTEETVHFAPLFSLNIMPQITKDTNGQPHVAVRNLAASGSVHLHGATVTGWTPTKHEPVLWTSSKAVYDGQTPIRGGVPICTPWFGGHPTDPDAPSHGLARTAEWTLDHVSETEEETKLGFGLELPGLKLSYNVLLSHSLKLVLKITNTGGGERRVEAALHTYLAVSDAREVTITGLENVAYLDKVGGPTQADATGEPIRFIGETDRVYGDTDDDVVLQDPSLKRQIIVAKAGGRSTVIWNPWVDKAARMKDFGDDEWTGMCCIESAAVGEDAWVLASGTTKTLQAEVSVAAL